MSSATKRIEIADFFAREMVRNRVVTVSFVRTASMVADVLTKALGPEKFFRFMDAIFGCRWLRLQVCCAACSASKAHP